MLDESKIKIVKSNRRSISVQILRDGTIEVRAPKLLPKFLINEFLKRHNDWIEKKLKTVEVSHAKSKSYSEGEEFVFLGKRYALKFGNFTSIQVKDDSFLFPQALGFRANEEIERWYIRQAKDFITKQTEHYANEMKTSFVSISFSDTKSKWGSCTHDNRLQFNWRLIMAPLLVVRYVIIHELAHTTEKNHSRTFWSKVARFNPSYREQIKWLKQHGDELVI